MRRARERASGDDFLAPLPLFAVAVMALNDRVLKPWLHDALTGKLSDFAICFFLPLFVSAVLDVVTRLDRTKRLAVGAVATLAVFVPLKTSALCLQWFLVGMATLGRPLGLYGMRGVVDPSDLVALVMVPLALLEASRRCARRGTPSSALG